jgi:hypothetical protein
MNIHLKNTLIGLGIILPILSILILAALYQPIMIGLAVFLVLIFILVLSYMIGYELTRKND